MKNPLAKMTLCCALVLGCTIKTHRVASGADQMPTTGSSNNGNQQNYQEGSGYRISDRGRVDKHAFPPPTKPVQLHGDQNNEKLRAAFPECSEEYVNDCNFDEVKVPCTNLCWRVCPNNRYWDEETASCKRIPHYRGLYITTEDLTKSCRRRHPDYRLPTLEEVTYVLGNCRAKQGKNQIICNSYHDSPMYYVVAPGHFDFVVDVPGRCRNQLDQDAFHCSWIGRLYGGALVLPTKFDYMFFYAGRGSAAANALCVREVD